MRVVFLRSQHPPLAWHQIEEANRISVHLDSFQGMSLHLHWGETSQMGSACMTWLHAKHASLQALLPSCKSTAGRRKDNTFKHGVPNFSVHSKFSSNGTWSESVYLLVCREDRPLERAVRVAPCKQ